MFSGLSLGGLALIGLAAATVILIAGLRMTALADRLADRTGLGEALVGGVLLGAATSISGTVVSATAALDGDASLAFSNSIGGIAAQTAFLAFADVLYRKANLEHAAAELANVFQCGMLLLLLSIPFAAYSTGSFTILGVHPASLALVAVYGIGVASTAKLRAEPMWRPVETGETRSDTPDAETEDSAGRSSKALIVAFLGLMVLMGVSGWLVARLAFELVGRFSISSSVVGALMTAILTSLPELVTTLGAVRRGALQLAVGGIIGGNMFDILFLTIADIGYRDGSIYHAIGRSDLFWLSVAAVMTAILLLGLIYRQRSGPGRIGTETVAMLAIYGGAVVLASV